MAPPALLLPAPTGTARDARADPLEPRAAFDADTASIDSASLVRDFRSRRDER